MANIDVQRKKSSPLLWIILVVAILGIAAYFVWNRYGNRTNTSQPAVYDSTNRTITDTTHH
ncbi:MAG: hypothetical protein ACTHMD_08410 [Flavisolibacter sp.]